MTLEKAVLLVKVHALLAWRSLASTLQVDKVRRTVCTQQVWPIRKKKCPVTS